MTWRKVAMLFIASALIGWRIGGLFSVGKEIPAGQGPSVNDGALLCHYPTGEAWIYTTTTAGVPRLLRQRALDPTCEAQPRKDGHATHPIPLA